MRLVQLHDRRRKKRLLGRVRTDGVSVLNITAGLPGIDSVFALERARAADPATDEIVENLGDLEVLEPDWTGGGDGDLVFLPPADAPDNPWALQLFGAGVTHRRSAEERDADASAHWGRTIDFYETMYRAGVEGGRPGAGVMGAKPEIFYKGHGHQAVPHGGALEIASLARRPSPEPEVVAYFMRNPDGTPGLIGFSGGNDFSDPGWETENPLYLFHAKVQDGLAALGPVFVTPDDPGLDLKEIAVRCCIHRDGEAVMDSGPLKTGENHMAHSLENLIRHLFHHRAMREDEVRGLFLGTTAVFPEAVRPGDVIDIEFDSGLGTLRNPVVRAED